MSALLTSVVSLEDALALGRPAWDRLAQGGVSSPFAGWLWHRAWADVMPAETVARTRVLTGRDAAGELRALLPLHAGRSRVGVVSAPALRWGTADDGYPDHLELLASSPEAAAALADAVARQPWRALALHNVAATSPRLAALSGALAGAGCRVLRRDTEICPYLDLPTSWDAYLASLSSNRRQIVRRKERNLSRDHAMVLTDYDSATFEQGWSLLLSLHGQRWQGRSAFEDPAVHKLHHRFAQLLAEAGQLWLATVHLDGVPAAAWYGFGYGDTVFFYQGGRDPRFDKDSVGAVLMGILIRRAIERGFKRFDFMRGDEPYKAQWTQQSRRTATVLVLRPGLAGGALQASDALMERARAARRSVKTWLVERRGAAKSRKPDGADAGPAPAEGGKGGG